jgi:hypothetical protein
MSEQEWKRLDAVGRGERGALTNVQAAQILGVSERHMRRLRRRVQEQGARAGVVHGNAGRASAQRLAQGIRELIVELRSTKYAGFNDRHFSEKLVEAAVGYAAGSAGFGAAAGESKHARAGHRGVRALSP